jgi:HD superfamily phosphohydrolase
MHIASQFLAASLRNATDDARARFCRALRGALRRQAVPDPEEAGRRLTNDVLTARHYVSEEFASHVALAEQALRLAALFHDLGHLPFSHDFEAGLEQYWHELSDDDKRNSPLASLLEQRVGRTQVHERIGHELSILLFQEIFDDLEPPETREAVQRVLALAHQLLEAGYYSARGEEEGAIYWLHSLIDSDVDCDRSDYLLRDALHHGFDFASYDLTRLLSNLTLALQGDQFIMGIRPQGLSSIESFLLSRFRSNKYGIRHHKVVQVGLGLRHVIGELLRAQPAGIPEFVSDLGDLAGGRVTTHSRRGFLERFRSYDEVWWTAAMRAGIGTSMESEWLRLVCWRAPGPVSLWKRRSEFPVPEAIREWNERLPARSDLAARQRWFEAVTELKASDVLVQQHRFVPWRSTSDGDAIFVVVQPDGSLMSINKLSSLVASLPEAWATEVQVQAFKTSASSATASEVFERLTEATEGSGV